MKGVRLRGRFGECAGGVVMTGGCCESVWGGQGVEGDTLLDPTAFWSCFAGIGRDDGDHPGPLCSGKGVCVSSCADEERIPCEMACEELRSGACPGDWFCEAGLCGC